MTKERISEREHSSENWLELAENFFETVYLARGTIEGDDIEKKRDLIKAVGENLFLKDKKLHFEFKKTIRCAIKAIHS